MNKMDILLEYLSSERSLLLGAAIIGFVSVLVGLVFLQFLPNYKAFALTMLIIGSIESTVFVSNYFNFPSKVEAQVEMYNQDKEQFKQKQITISQSALKSFFWLKIIYAVLIVIFAILISRLNVDSVLAWILSALILHLAFAITIDNFGERYTKKYNSELKKNDAIFEIESLVVIK